MNRADKNIELDRLTAGFEQAQLRLCADFRGLTVGQMTELRRELRGAGAECKVVKNTLGRISAGRALKDSDQSDRERFLQLFAGPNLLVFTGEDPVAPAKVFAKYAKDWDAFKIKGGWFEGRFLDQQDVMELSSMPSREEVLAKLLNLLNTPATQLLRILNAPATQLTRVLEAWRGKLEEGA